MSNIINADLDFKDKLVPLKLDKIKFIVIHHIKAKTASWQEIDRWHKDQDPPWLGIGYNEYIRKDGSIYICRGDNIGAQCLGFNSCSYGIAVEGDYDVEENVPDAQYNALIERIKYNLGRFPKNCVVVPHRELVDTECPGDKFPMTKLLQDIKIVSDSFGQVLDTLKNAGIINSADYWAKAANPNSLLNTNYVKILLENMAKYVSKVK